MSDYHEPAEELSEKTRDYTRALRSLIEEVEAVMWYQQRVDVTKDQQLRKILEHNRDEEIEHACMALEYLRRTMPAWDEELKTYLFTTGDIVEIEEGEVGEEQEKEEGNEDLGIGNLKQ
jgi:ferritin-like protein